VSAAVIERPAGARACVFTLAGSRFAVEVSRAQEVVVFGGLTPVPLAPPFLMGLANLRGTVMPIVDLGPLLGLPARAPAPQILGIVLAHGPWVAAAAIDAVLGLEPLGAPSPLGEAARRRWGRLAAGVAAGAAGEVTVLDAGAVLDALRGAFTGASGMDGTTRSQGGGG
jgi:purine-binding chemotaxis protein CheW